MKKRDLYQHIVALDDRIDKHVRDLGSLETRLSQVMQMVNALTDKLDAQDANETLAADVADLDAQEGFVPAFPRDYEKHMDWHYGRSPLEFLDDPIDESTKKDTDIPALREWWLGQVGQPGRLTAREVVEAAQALDREPDAFDEVMTEILKSTSATLDKLLSGGHSFEPTGDDLDEVDNLIDNIMDDRDQ